MFAIENDRFYTDGRIRNAYMCGRLIDKRTGKSRLPGWWNPLENRWDEDRFQVSTHVGNVAWVAIALLTYHKETEDAKSLETAIKLAEWIDREAKDDRGTGGFTGGTEGWEPNAEKILWKSTEHNLDIIPLARRLAEITGEERWNVMADHAQRFVESMWDAEAGHFWTGTFDDGVAINQDAIPIDIQAWAVLVFDEYEEALDWARNNCTVVSGGLEGFGFRCAQPEPYIWTEGTAQMGTVNFKAVQSD